MGLGKINRISLDDSSITTPVIWLGHDLFQSIKVWNHLDYCPGLMLNAYNFYQKPRVTEKAKNIGIKKMLNFKGNIFLDSGGFLFQRTGKSKVDVNDLLILYKELVPEFAAILDIPLSPLATNTSNYRRWTKTIQNTRYMFESNSLLNLIPILHTYNKNLVQKRLEQIRQINPALKILGVGSLVPLFMNSFIGDKFSIYKKKVSPKLGRWDFISDLMLAIKKNNSDLILHAFGAGSLSTIYLLSMLGVDSFDSTSWRTKAAFGEIILPGSTNRNVSKIVSLTRYRRKLDDNELELLSNCGCPFCSEKNMRNRLSTLQKFAVARATHNAYVFISEIENLRKAINMKRHYQFVADRLKKSEFFTRILNEIIIPKLQ